MKALFEGLQDQMKKNRDSVVAVLVKNNCEESNIAGTHILIDERGIIAGHFYNDQIEHCLIKCAEELFECCGCIRQKFHYMSSDDTKEEAIFCLCYVRAEDLRMRQMVKRALELLREGTRMWIVADLERGELSIVDALGVACGCEIPEEIYAERKLKPIVIRKKTEYYMEPVQYPGVVYIMGSSNIAVELSKLLVKGGFCVEVIGDNIEWANRENFPEVYDVRVMKYQEMEELLIQTEDYIVVATGDVLKDEKVLEIMMKLQARGVYTVNTGKKNWRGTEWLQKQGYEAQLLNKVHEITVEEHKCRTPYEIAIAIMAEIMKSR